jgi:A/G-specific adenine glycosylase
VADLPKLSSALRDAILAWYGAEGRSLPFRATADPFAILVSEAMAQQTQAARAGEAWIRFMARFPTAAALAAATPADVLRAWHGLGYNRRALNLWRAARQIVELHGGKVPVDLAALQALPGVGPYTARAVAALAFGQPVGAVDTNVRRVLGRIVAGHGALALGAVMLQEIADAAVPHDRPAAWTHALMDIGAAVCRPRRPHCEACPARDWCRYVRDSRATQDESGPAVAGSGRSTTRTAARETSPPFTTTARWLRGTIVDHLRLIDGDGWTRIEGPIGAHDPAAVAAALEALARDGLVEIDRSGTSGRGRRARLPVS